MPLLDKLKEVVVSVLPVSLIVLILHFTIAPLAPGMLPQFIAGSLLLILGLALFLMGIDLGVLPMGQQMGGALTRSKKIVFMLAASFFIGFMVTLAEPDLHVLGDQLAAINDKIPKALLLVVVSVGVGIFVAVGLLRSVFRLPLKIILFFGYILVFFLAIFASPYLLPVSFDSGGVTTGPMTVPFIMALCIGLAQLRAGTDREAEDDNFGLVALMSLGPILATLILGLIFKDDMSAAVYQVEGLTNFAALLSRLALEVAVALLPMLVIFLLFQQFILKLPVRRVLRMILGLLYTYLGLVVFLLGVNFGFLPAGSFLGKTLASLPYRWVIIPIGVLFGLTIAMAEPAVWVLTQQIEKITAGLIPKKLMLLTLSAGIAVAVGLSMLRIYARIQIMWMLIPGYGIALALMPFVDDIFTAIAFDSGGVASGAMASTFILPFALGACAAAGGNVLTDAFGVVAMIAMIPLIAIQLLGLVFRLKRERADADFDALTRIEAEIEAEEAAADPDGAQEQPPGAAGPPADRSADADGAQEQTAEGAGRT